MSRNGYWLLGLIAILVIAVGETNAQDFQNVTCINRFYHNWGSGVYDVAVNGDYAYLACHDDGLHILNIADQNAIREVSYLAYEGTGVVTTAGDYAYVVTWQNGIYVIDISNPASPQEVFNIPMNCDINTLEVDGDYLFVGTNLHGFIIIDISEPEAAHVVGQTDSYYAVVGLAVRGNMVYTASEYPGLVRWDISDITTPVIAGSYPLETGDWVTGVDVSGDYAYITCGWEGLRVVDLNTMTAVAAIDSLIYAFKVVIKDQYAYMTYGDPECPLAVIDISNPAQPQTLGIYYPPEDARDFAVDGSTAYVADRFHGLRVVDCTNPVSPQETAVYSRYGHDYDVCVLDNYAYVREDYKLKIIDISDLQNPVETGYFENTWQINSVKIVGDMAYVVDHSYNCLHVIDISNPYAPTPMGTYEAPSDVHYQLDIYGSYAYLSDNYGIEIIDISNPAEMVSVGRYNEHVGNAKIAIADHYVFLIPSTGPMRVMDLSPDPTTPTVVTSYDLNDWCNEVKAKDGILYILTSHKLWAFEIGGFDNWEPIYQEILYNDLSYLQGMDFYGEYLYVTNQTHGLSVYDVHNPSSPQRVGFSPTPGSAQGVCALGKIAIVADGDNLGFYDCSAAITGIGSNTDILPGQFALLSNYPNPFNSSTNIQFELAAGGNIQLAIYDALGRQVKALADYQASPGKYSLNWDGTDGSGRTVASGRYYIRASAEGQVRSLPVTLLK